MFALFIGRRLVDCDVTGIDVTDLINQCTQKVGRHTGKRERTKRKA